MGPQRARAVIESLLQGQHPVSGAALASEMILQETSVLRALFLLVEALKIAERRAIRRGLMPSNVGRPWTAEEETRLRQAFARQSSVEEIAHAHRRTPRAVCQRLVRLELLSLDSPESAMYVGTLPLRVPARKIHTDE